MYIGISSIHHFHFVESFYFLFLVYYSINYKNYKLNKSTTFCCCPQHKMHGTFYNAFCLLNFPQFFMKLNEQCLILSYLLKFLWGRTWDPLFLCKLFLWPIRPFPQLLSHRFRLHIYIYIYIWILSHMYQTWGTSKDYLIQCNSKRNR